MLSNLECKLLCQQTCDIATYGSACILHGVLVTRPVHDFTAGLAQHVRFDQTYFEVKVAFGRLVGVLIFI